jgi:hypothetical protein
MYFQQCTAKGHVSMHSLERSDAIMDIVAEKLFRALRTHAEEAGVPDFRADDCDIHTHVEEAIEAVEVAMVWNPQPGKIELLGGPSDGLEWDIADPDMDHVRVEPPKHRRDHWAEPVLKESPPPVLYSRWMINGDTRKWVYKYTDTRLEL